MWPDRGQWWKGNVMSEWAKEWIRNSSEALSFLKTTTWVGTGIIGIAVILRLINLFVCFKAKSREQKLKDVLDVVVLLFLVGVFWCIFLIWGKFIVAGYV